ncbi:MULTISPECIES: 4-alpha-glucanotransferase [Pantoea]|uniref:4-alpha-glucanotransferase n=2 Tax=Pantoea TaxID=53335 RepID=A0A0U3UA87_9GAMM|nr:MULTISPECIES: 4-alpha-glucanotransferase [Pantoea]ALV90722.1 4-alpha-glucanotransferase [Pantoea vagans]KHJ67164.1 4-alpha-glucanotransferase [Pantoea rodasii]
MTLSKLDQDALAAGIAVEFINAKGEPESISDVTKRALLAVMDTPVGKVPPLPPVQVFTPRAKRQLTPQGKGEFSWQLQSEQGKTFSGTLQGGEALALPPRLPQGYHSFTLRQGRKQWQTRIIIAPRRCYLPEPLQQGEKRWGALVQLYTLRSDSNWGIGDFGDLQQMLEQVAANGGDFVGLNPLHALYPAQPDHASPYSPTSRRWLNVLYIDVNQVAAFAQSEEAQRWWELAKTRTVLKQARATDWVDYSAVAALKIAALRFAWQSWKPDADFQQFVAEGGDALRYQAAFDGILAERAASHPDEWGWEKWPEGWRHAHQPEVQQWCADHEDEIQFWSWLQWLAQQQFAACWQRSQQLGMAVGLYRDLAVGVAQHSAETWLDPQLYKLGASVGAPPDRLGPLGQNWALPPLDPHVMRARGYQPFIDLLRANMRDCGALRIDHVMALLRLWWIPYGEGADKGAYVSYPVDELMAILALESQRHGCMVIGEDLGTVPPMIVRMLRSHGIFSWKVLFFEQERDGRYRPPSAYPRQSIASASTHDLPTLSGFWQAGDLTLGEKLGMYRGSVLQSLQQQRVTQKQALLDALQQAGALSAQGTELANEQSLTPALNLAMHRFLAQTGSALLGLQPEDWLGMTSPVNVPGTVNEYPNWRRKLSITLEEMFDDKAVQQVMKAVTVGRKEA